MGPWGGAAPIAEVYEWLPRPGRPGRGGRGGSPPGRRADGSGQVPGQAGPAHRYRDLLAHLSTLDRQAISFARQKIEKLTPRP